MVTEKRLKDLQNMLHQYIDEADERDISWLMKWHNVKKQSAFFGLSEKRLKKAVSDLRALTLGRQIREN